MSAPLRVVVAEDHETVRQGLRALLETLPDLEVVAEAGDAEMAVLTTQRVAPDIVVIDLSMPKAGGLTAIRRIRDSHVKSAIIVLTRHQEPVFVQEALAAGAAAYVLKQSPFTELRQAVAAVRSGGRYVDRHFAQPSTSPALEDVRTASHREQEVLRRTAGGDSNKEIAAALNISVKTVEAHKSNGMRKLALRDRRDLMRYAKLSGWLSEW